MIDTNTTTSKVLNCFQKNQSLASSEVHSKLDQTVSLVTIKRNLSELYKQGYLEQRGGGRSIKYSLSRKGTLLKPIIPDEYLDIPQEKRLVTKNYNFDLFKLPFQTVFTQDELKQLDQATTEFKSKDSHEVHDKELQRFMIEMSWKSAKIEGNTYTLLDTEQLLAYGIKSSKNTEFETQMLLNQKAAFEFVLQTQELWKNINLSLIKELHEHIIEKLGVKKNLRSNIVGITGTDYQPIGNKFQLKEALEQLLTYINHAPNAYEKALSLTLGLSYIQPFADGNKRTSRMCTNGLLLNAGLAPISYRAVDESAYKKAVLVFYEQNSVVPFKKLFIEQYIYSATHYNIFRS